MMRLAGSITGFGFSLVAGLLLLALPLQAQDFSWVRGIGGALDDLASDVATDAAGNVYVTGYFGWTADFDPGVGVANLTTADSSDIFVLKLDSAGSFVWARSMGGTYEDVARSIFVDAAGNVYTTGHFAGTADFDPGAGVANLTSGAGTTPLFPNLTAPATLFGRRRWEAEVSLGLAI